MRQTIRDKLEHRAHGSEVFGGVSAQLVMELDSLARLTMIE